MSNRPVDRCVCHDVSFAELVRLHRDSGADLEELIDRTHASTGCGLCYHYIRAALATGEMRFPVLSDAALEKLTREAQEKGPAPSDAGPDQ